LMWFWKVETDVCMYVPIFILQEAEKGCSLARTNS